MKNQKDEVITGNTQHLKILYQDEWILVVYKPSGLLSVSVNQNHKICELKGELDEYYKMSRNYTDNKLAMRTRELDDMYQSMNARFNKHIIEHTMKGRL
jgi:23S rRNA-/tRNA-specific pseudouridylate synthase